jgi:hypothetical protein
MFAYLGVGSVSERGAHKRGFLRGFSVEGTKAKRDRHLRFPRRKAVARAFQLWNVFVLRKYKRQDVCYLR